MRLFIFSESLPGCVASESGTGPNLYIKAPKILTGVTHRSDSNAQAAASGVP